MKRGETVGHWLHLHTVKFCEHDMPRVGLGNCRISSMLILAGWCNRPLFRLICFCICYQLHCIVVQVFYVLCCSYECLRMLHGLFCSSQEIVWDECLWNVVLCEYSKFRIESNSYSSIRFDSKRVQLFKIFEYLPSLISYLKKLRKASYLTEWRRCFTFQPWLATNKINVILAHYSPPSNETPTTETTTVQCYKTVEFI